MEIGFSRCNSKFGMYTKGTKETYILLVCIYVDDLLVTGSCPKEINNFKASMKKEFEMSGLGKISYFLGLQFLDT